MSSSFERVILGFRIFFLFRNRCLIELLIGGREIRMMESQCRLLTDLHLCSRGSIHQKSSFTLRRSESKESPLYHVLLKEQKDDLNVSSVLYSWVHIQGVFVSSQKSIFGLSSKRPDYSYLSVKTPGVGSKSNLIIKDLVSKKPQTGWKKIPWILLCIFE